VTLDLGLVPAPCLVSGLKIRIRIGIRKNFRGCARAHTHVASSPCFAVFSPRMPMDRRTLEILRGPARVLSGPMWPLSGFIPLSIIAFTSKSISKVNFSPNDVFVQISLRERGRQGAQENCSNKICQVFFELDCDLPTFFFEQCFRFFSMGFSFAVII